MQVTLAICVLAARKLCWYFAVCGCFVRATCAPWQRNMNDVTRQWNELSCRFKNFALILRLWGVFSTASAYCRTCNDAVLPAGYTRDYRRAINRTTHGAMQLHYDVIYRHCTLRECTQKGRDLKSPVNSANVAERLGSLWSRHRTWSRSGEDRGPHKCTHKDVGSALSKTRWRNVQLPANTDTCQLRGRRNNRYDRDTRSGELTTWTDATRRGISRVLLLAIAVHWWTSCVAELSCTAWWRASSS